MILRYDTQKLAMDVARGVSGLIATLGPVIFVDAILPGVAKILGTIAILFTIFLIRVAFRFKTEINLSEDGITVKSPGRERSLKWVDLKKVRFSCYRSLRSREGEGVMSLKLSGNGTKIVVESSLKGFDTLVGVAAQICNRFDISVDHTTVYNFNAVGSPIQRD